MRASLEGNAVVVGTGASGGKRWFRRRVMPGFGLTLGVTSTYLTLIVLLPIGALLLKAAGVGWPAFWSAVSGPRAMATYALTLSAAAKAAVFTALFGLLLAWVIVRYRFVGRRLLDAIVDLPFALPTAVAGITLATLFGPNGWLGRPLMDLFGLQVSYTPLGVAVAMAFVGVPFVVRSVQPVLEEIDQDVEEAAAGLGAGDLAIFLRVILPMLFPSLVAGAALAFARGLGEYGAVIFIAANIPLQTEVTTQLAMIRLEEFDYPASAAVSTVMLAVAFVSLFATNAIQIWSLRWNVRP